MSKTSSKKNVQLLVNKCVKFNINYVVISPGSRNAPLIIAFNQHPEIKCVVIPDERSAAFIALGMAQQLNQAVAIVCTSGSALLNYYPAIAEAYYQRIPLVVISADRPQSWINQGDGQTIVQQNVFRNHINYFVQIDDVDGTNEQNWHINRELSTAFQHALGLSKGPIHINLSLAEPLYETIEIPEEDQLKSNNNNKFSSFNLEFPRPQLTYKQKEQLSNSWKKSSKKLILCGQMNKNVQLNNLLNVLSDDTSVLILVENTSNLKGKNFIHCIDRLLNSISDEELNDFIPEILITLGGAIVSKRIKNLLRNHPPLEHWKIGYDFPFSDTFQCLTHSFLIDEIDFIDELTNYKSISNSSFASKWKMKDYLIQKKQSEYFNSNKEISDITTFNLILDCIPENTQLHMANSSVVRYCQLFDPISTFTYWSNRGTSGIDGCSSTAKGSAYISKNDLHVLISGDMSFFYDSNAFWNHLKTPNLKIFLINNGGGGIFKIIPGPDKTEELNEFFVFDNDFSAEHICKTFNINYFKASNLVEIEHQMSQFIELNENDSCSLMEIFTQTVKNEQELKKYFEAVKILNA
jgi:2-succinyl-5-enolpyruvyl-6-hydroxy-3-cyclohexene-1-carboxylate synthase